MRKRTLRCLQLFNICISAIILISSMSYNYENVVESKVQTNKYLRSDVNGALKAMRGLYILVEPEPEMLKEKVAEMNPENNDTFIVVVTAYDLSFQSTGKTKSHPAYGISRSGVDLKGESWDSARAISADPNLIPLESKVLIEFIDEKYKKYSGEYLNCDTGNGVKNYHIDFFMGDFGSFKPNKQTISFGVTRAKVTILEN